MPAPDDHVDALEANLWSMWSGFGAGDGCRLVDEPGILRFETPVAHVPYNTVLRCSSVDEELIDGALASYRSRGVPFVWIVHPTSPAGLPELLGARGLVEAEVVTGMTMPLERLPGAGASPEAIVIDEIGPTDHEPYLDLLTWRYGLASDDVDTLRSIMRAGRFGVAGSRNRSWVARRGDEVLCKVTIHHDGAVAGLYGLATRPEARGLGLGRILTLRAAFSDARGAGADLGVLHSTPMAVSLYQGIGFDEIANFGLWAEPDTLHL